MIRANKENARRLRGRFLRLLGCHARSWNANNADREQDQGA